MKKNENRQFIPGHSIGWKVQERMAAAGIDTVAALHKRLQKIDPGAVNYTQFCRVVATPPARISLRLIAGIAIALDCAIGDLVEVRPSAQSERSPS